MPGHQPPQNGQDVIGHYRPVLVLYLIEQPDDFRPFDAFDRPRPEFWVEIALENAASLGNAAKSLFFPAQVLIANRSERIGGVGLGPAYFGYLHKFRLDDTVNAGLLNQV